jgi:raffinose/stachyose/melibiose transport system permease protein
MAIGSVQPESSPRTPPHKARMFLGRYSAARVSWMLVPSLLLIIGFAWYPAIQALVFSLFSWNGVDAPSWIGLQNFQDYLSSDTLGDQVRNIAILGIGSLVIQMTAPLLAAELVFNMHSSRAAGIYRALLVIPIAVPFIINVEIWSYLYYPQIGLFSTLIQDLGLQNTITTTFTGDPNAALYCILAVGFPWVANLGFLIYLAGLQTIPGELIEAFRLEESGFWHRLWLLDIPLIRGQMRLVLVLTLVTTLQNFVTILVMTNGGPGTATLVPGLQMYNEAFRNDQFGLGMAIATLMFLVILVITLVILRLGRDDTEGAR